MNLVNVDTLEKIASAKQTATFCQRFCARFRCPPDRFDQAVLWMCLRPWARPLARVAWVFWLGYFEADLELIEDVKGATSYDHARKIIGCSHGPVMSNWLRRIFKIRMSRRKLLALLRVVMEGESRVGNAKA